MSAASDGREMEMDVRGRSCPLAYQYRPEVLAEPAQLQADTLFVVGGPYGNILALRVVIERADREPAVIVFSGDFHWLDVDPRTSSPSARQSSPITQSRATSKPN